MRVADRKEFVDGKKDDSRASLSIRLSNEPV